MLLQVFDRLWSVLDTNGDGVLDYGEFSRGFFGEMSERRKACVRKVQYRSRVTLPRARASLARSSGGKVTCKSYCF